MGDALRRRVLLYLGLGQVWVELRAISTRLKRLEGELYGGKAPQPLPTRPTGDRQVSTVPGVPKSKSRQNRGVS